MFNIIVILFDFQLIYFHLWITNHGISTFDYIVFKREEKAQKEKVKVSTCISYLIIAF